VGLFEQAIAAARGASDDAIREQAMYQQGWALSRLGRSAESAGAFDSLEREYPAGRLAGEAFFKVADKALQDGRFDDARRGFDRVAREFPHGPLAARALYWSAEAVRRSGDARASLDGFWACLAAEPDQGILFSALDGYRAALLAVGDLAVAESYALMAQAGKGLPAEASAALQLDYAQLLLASSPVRARSVIRGVQAGAPPEPIAGEATLLWGMCDAAEGDWSRAIEVFQALERSRADEVGARAVLQHGAALEAAGFTAEAVEQYLKISWRFPHLSDLGAEGLFDAVRLARARGDGPRAAALEQGLRARYPASPWVSRLRRD
jgi:tetratricopeptide (TPR) repeat protein